MIAGHRSGSRRRQRMSRRWPIVSTLGLTRSNGSVSQPGKWTTSPGGRNWARSSASWPAIVPVGQLTTSGRRDDKVDERSDRDRAGHLHHGESGLGFAERPRQPRLVTQHRRQRAERRPRRALPRAAPHSGRHPTHAGPNPKNRVSVALSATLARHFGSESGFWPDVERDHRLPLYRCMAASTPWATINSTASAALAISMSRSSRSRLGTFDSTWPLPTSL